MTHFYRCMTLHEVQAWWYHSGRSSSFISLITRALSDTEKWPFRMHGTAYTTSLPRFDRKDVWIQGITQDSQKEYGMLSGMLPSKICGFNKKIPEEPGSKNPPKAPPRCLRRSCFPSQNDGWMAGGHLYKTNPNFMQNYYEVLAIKTSCVIMRYYQSTVRALLLWGITNANNSITIDKNAFCIREMTPLFRFLLQLGT